MIVMENSLLFCPFCGQELVRRFVPEEGRERLVCQQNHILYENPKVVAGAIPIADERIWLARRAIEPRAGTWTFPSGFMELGETVEDAARREALEEMNLEIQLTGLLNVYSRPSSPTVFIVYTAQAFGPATPGHESLEVRAYRPEEIPWDELAFWSTHMALKDWLRIHS
jgi:ADP-ribose pyrophosphatase YjhB (NUDIX family)